MKKVLILIAVVFFIFPTSVKAIYAESAIVMDQDSKRVLFEKSAHKKKLIASTTKIMTALVVIENVDLQKVVTVNEEVLKAYGSAIYIEVGEEITILDLLYGLMLRSGNDAAIVLAIETASSMEDFAKLMNQKAAKIGMKNTMFYNSHGLEEKGNIGNTSTAYDMALLTSEAMKNETFRTIFGTETYVAKTSYKTYTWKNKNRLLKSYEFTTGGKTGFTELANRTLVTTATKDNKNLIVVTLNDGNDFADHKKLYEQYFKEYNLVTVLNKDDFTVENDEHYKRHRLVIKNDYKILLKENEVNAIKTVVELEKNTFYKDNQRVGKVAIYLNNQLMHEEGIYVLKNENDKEEKPSFWKKVWEKIKFWD